MIGIRQHLAKAQVTKTIKNMSFFRNESIFIALMACHQGVAESNWIPCKLLTLLRCLSALEQRTMAVAECQSRPSVSSVAFEVQSLTAKVA